MAYEINGLLVLLKEEDYLMTKKPGGLCVIGIGISRGQALRAARRSVSSDFTGRLTNNADKINIPIELKSMGFEKLITR